MTVGHHLFKVYDKRDNFSFSIVNFPFLWGLALVPLYGGYISHLVGFARVCTKVLFLMIAVFILLVNFCKGKQI